MRRHLLTLKPRKMRTGDADDEYRKKKGLEKQDDEDDKMARYLPVTNFAYLV